jgi:hypothetical protein
MGVERIGTKRERGRKSRMYLDLIVRANIDTHAVLPSIFLVDLANGTREMKRL